MLRAFDDFQLKRLRQAVEVFGIAADSHHDVRIVLRIVIGFSKRLRVHDGDLYLQATAMEVGHYEGFRALAVLRRGDHVAVEAHVEDWRSKIFGLVGSRDGIDEGRRPAGVRALDGSEGIADGGAGVAAVRRCGDVGAFVRICREEVDERNVGAMRERTRVDCVRYFVDDALRQRIRFGVVVAKLRHGENLREQARRMTTRALTVFVRPRMPMRPLL